MSSGIAVVKRKRLSSNPCRALRVKFKASVKDRFIIFTYLIYGISIRIGDKKAHEQTDF